MHHEGTLELGSAGWGRARPLLDLSLLGEPQVFKRPVAWALQSGDTLQLPDLTSPHLIFEVIKMPRGQAMEVFQADRLRGGHSTCKGFDKVLT